MDSLCWSSSSWLKTLMGPGTGVLVESKHNSERITEKKYAAHLFNGLSASKGNIKIRCLHFTLSQDMYLQEAFTGMQMSQVGVVYIVFQGSGTSSHSRPLPLPFNFIMNESTDIHQGHVSTEGGQRKSLDMQIIQE